VTTSQMVINDRELESNIIFGHAKPPKVGVQLSGVSSKTSLFFKQMKDQP
jgi:hypothetical protein